MSYFAKVDNDGTVLAIYSASPKYIYDGNLGDPFRFIQTSYNNNFRKQYAEIGGSYDRINDVFIKPQPHPSWSLDNNFDWQPPYAMPVDDQNYFWDETSLSWVVATTP